MKMRLGNRDEWRTLLATYRQQPIRMVAATPLALVLIAYTLVSDRWRRRLPS